MNNKYLIGGVVLALVLSVFGLLNRSSGPISNDGNGLFGSTVGPEESNDFHCYAGGCQFFPRQPLSATSSTICSLRNNSGGTTTITSFRASIFGTATNMGIAAATFDLSTSSNPYSTTTPRLIQGGTIAALTTANMKSIVWTPGVASTTNPLVWGYDRLLATGESPFLLGPGERINLKIASGTPGTFASYDTGFCSATLLAP